jgi:hypothetical protein
MSRSARRWIVACSVVTAVGSVVASGIAIAAAPASASNSHAVRSQPNALPSLPGLPTLPPLPIPTPTLPIPIPTPTLPIPTDPCTVVPQLPICGGGGLPGGVSTVALAPTPAKNTVTAEVATITDPLENIYHQLGGVELQLVGPNAGTDVINGTGITFDDTAGTITGTFDLAGGLGVPAGPGNYTLNIVPSNNAAGLAIEQLPVTVTADPPTPLAALAVQPGKTAQALVGTSLVPFASGDTVSVTGPGDAPVSGLTFTTQSVVASTISGKLQATSAVALGTYDLKVTDTANQVGTCTGCVVVTNLGPVTNLKAAANTPSTAAVSFGPPAGSTSAVTGYSVVVSKIAGRLTSDTGITVHQTGTTPSATVTGLTAATKYFVTVAAKAGSASGVPATAAFFTPHPTRLTLATTRKHIKVGKQLTLIGQLTHKVGSASSGLRAQKVLLFAKIGKSRQPVKLATAKTDGSGKYRYAFKPTRTATYIAVFLGTKSTSSTSGDSLTFAVARPVAVKPTIVLRGHFKKHAGGSWLVLKGKVRPNQTGRKVIIERIVKGGVKKLGTAKLKGKSKRLSKFTLVEKHLPSGTYRVRARIKATPSNTAAHSKPRTFKH